MAFANGTLINVNSNDQKPINTFVLGDGFYGASEKEPMQWQQQVIKFSEGTPDGSPLQMLYITYKQYDEQNSIIVTRDHVFLTASGEIKQAVNLEPGRDQLVNANGQGVDILYISQGMYNKGVHYIAANMSFDESAYWILSQGIVSGDYLMQLTHL